MGLSINDVIRNNWIETMIQVKVLDFRYVCSVSKLDRVTGDGVENRDQISHFLPPTPPCKI